MMLASLAERSHYPALGDHIYLNQASLGLIGQPAVTAMHSSLEDVARHGNLYMSDSEELRYCSALRECAARLFRADSSKIAIVASASEILGQFPLCLSLEKGDVVLTSLPTSQPLRAHGFGSPCLGPSVFILWMIFPNAT